MSARDSTPPRPPHLAPLAHLAQSAYLARTARAMLGTLALACAAAGGSSARAQDTPDDGVAFTYLRGESSWRELDEFIGRVHRRTPQGKSALEHLVKRIFVEAEARRRGLTIEAAEYAAFLERHRRDLEKRGLGKLETWLAEEGIDRATFERLARIDLLLEKLVRHDLRLGASAIPTPAQSQVWLADRAAASTRAIAGTHAGVVARVEDKDIDLRELGRTVRRNLSRDALLKLARDAAVEASVAREARRRGIALDGPALEGEVARMRGDLAEHPRLSHLPFADYLEQLGHDERSLLEDPNFRTRAWLHALVASQRDAEGWRAYYRSRRAEFDRALGERRDAEWILCRGADEANALVTRTLTRAKEILADLRARMGKDLGFGQAARIYSDDDATKEFEGRLGWISRLSTRAEKSVVDALFELAPETVSEPVRTRDGYALLRVRGVQGPPDEARMVERVIAYEVSRERAALLQRLEVAPRF